MSLGSLRSLREEEYPLRFCRKDGNDGVIDVVAVFTATRLFWRPFIPLQFLRTAHAQHRGNVSSYSYYTVVHTSRIKRRPGARPFPKQPHTISEGKRY